MKDSSNLKLSTNKTIFFQLNLTWILQVLCSCWSGGDLLIKKTSTKYRRGGTHSAAAFLLVLQHNCRVWTKCCCIYHQIWDTSLYFQEKGWEKFPKWGLHRVDFLIGRSSIHYCSSLFCSDLCLFWQRLIA